MKLSSATRVIEFLLERTMEHTQKIFVAFAIAFFVSLSSAAYIKEDLNSVKDFARNEPLRTLREKRHQNEQLDLFAEDDALKLSDKSSEFPEKRAITEASEDNDKHEELSVEDKIAPYKGVHDVIHAIADVDDKELIEKLRELRESSTGPDGKSLKRHIAHPAGNILGAGFLDVIPLTQLDGHSCENEAFHFGHSHHSGRLTHEFFCELRKLHHYGLISFRNLRSELSLGPMTTEEFEGNVFDSFYRRVPQLLETIIREPHHLLMLPEIIRDVVPFSSIFRAFHRIKHSLCNVVHFVFHVIRTHMSHLFERFLLHHRLGLNLVRIVIDIARKAGHFFLGHFGLELPIEKIFAEPILVLESPVIYGNEMLIPEYRHSFNELITSLRGIHDGYYASGIHELFKSYLSTFSSASSTAVATSFLSKVPFAERFMPFLNGFGAAAVNPIVEGYLPMAGPIMGGLAPAMSPIAPIETETVSTSVSSASSAASTIAAPIARGPVISPYGFNPLVAPAVTETVTSSAASSASASTVDVASPVVAPVLGGPMIGPYGTHHSIVSPIAPAMTETVTSSAASSASASTVDVASPVVAPVLGGPMIGPYGTHHSIVSPIAPAMTETVTSSAASSASSSSTVTDVASPVVAGPVISPVGDLPPIVSPISHVVPVETEAASASSSASSSATTTTTTTVVEPVAEPIIAAEPCAPVVAPAIQFAPAHALAPAVSHSETTSVSQSSSSSVSVSEAAPAVVEAVPAFAHYAAAPLVVPSAVESTVTTSTASASSASSATEAAAAPFGYPGYHHSGFLSSGAPAVATAAAASAASSGAASAASSAASVVSRRTFNFDLPRERIITAVGNDCMLPGDVVAVTLRNNDVLYGNVLDAHSPITFSFLRPRLSGAHLRKGSRVWNVLHSDFTDADAFERFNDPVLLGI